jgi:hypothetical protein
MLRLLLLIVVASIVIRVILSPFRYGFRRRFDYRDRFYNPYLYGCRRHHGVLGGLLPILALVALDRLFTRRY